MAIFLNDTARFHSRPYLNIGETVALQVAMDLTG
jgi:hypothetical protein